MTRHAPAGTFEMTSELASTRCTGPFSQRLEFHTHTALVKGLMRFLAISCQRSGVGSGQRFFRSLALGQGWSKSTGPAAGAPVSGGLIRVPS